MSARGYAIHSVCLQLSFFPLHQAYCPEIFLLEPTLAMKGVLSSDDESSRISYGCNSADQTQPNDGKYRQANMAAFDKGGERGEWAIPFPVAVFQPLVLCCPALKIFFVPMNSMDILFFCVNFPTEFIIHPKRFRNENPFTNLEYLTSKTFRKEKNHSLCETDASTCNLECQHNLMISFISTVVNLTARFSDPGSSRDEDRVQNDEIE